MQPGFQVIEEFIWSKFDQFLDRYIQFFAALKRRCGEYIGVQFTLNLFETVFAI